MVRCRYCREHIDVKEYDEYTPDDLEEGFAIPYDNMPDRKNEIHIWKDDGNLFMHFVKNNEVSDHNGRKT